jgi:hypothetical protein
MKFQPLIGTDLSGSLGGIVASTNTYGQYFRKRVHPTNTRTPGQLEQRAALADCSQLWRTLETVQRDAWGAARLVKVSRKGHRVILSGQSAFMFVNTLRFRLGLSNILDPPTDPEPCPFTLPSGVLTADGKLSLSFTVSDPWNAADGAVLVSGSCPLSPGRKWWQFFSPVGKALGPVSNPVLFDYPFSVAEGDRVRLRFHASSPNGRQSILQELDLTVLAAGNYVVRVSSDNGLARWEFTYPVTFTATPTNLKVVDNNPTDAEQSGPNGILCTYSSPVNFGVGWSIPAAVTNLTSSPPIAFPQSGKVID